MSIPRTMLAARVYGTEGLRLEEIPVPDMRDDDSMLVKIRSCAVCNGSDWIHIQDRQKSDSTQPVTLGHEASGDVVAVGAKVRDFVVGDRVTFWCALGSFAEYNCIRPARLAMGKLGDNITYEQGAVIQLVCAVLRGIDSAEITEGDRVLVLGQGPVGLLATQCALAYGAEFVAATDTLPNRLALAKQLGAKVAVNAAEVDFVKAIRDQVGEVDVVFDAMWDDLAPEKDTMARSMQLMARNGRYVIFGMSNELRSFNVRTVYGRRLRIITTDTSDERAQQLMEKACDLVADGTVDCTSFITHRFSLKELPQALDLVRNRPRDAVKIVINIPE